MTFPAVRTGVDELDAQEIFTALDRLTLTEGYALDYVYVYDGHGGYPVLYLRGVEEEPFATRAELAIARGTDSGTPDTLSVLADVHADGTTEGVLQLALFWLLADQFYVFWHSNYDRRIVVCDRAGAERAAHSMESAPTETSGAASEMRCLNVNPHFSRDGERFELSLAAFWNFGGVYRITASGLVDYPHEFTEKDRALLIENVPGYVF
jgi:hypothetical protein